MDLCFTPAFSDALDFWEMGKFGRTSALSDHQDAEPPRKTPQEPKMALLQLWQGLDTWALNRPGDEDDDEDEEENGRRCSAAVVGEKNNCRETKIRFLKFPEKTSRIPPSLPVSDPEKHHRGRGGRGRRERGRGRERINGRGKKGRRREADLGEEEEEKEGEIKGARKVDEGGRRGERMREGGRKREESKAGRKEGRMKERNMR